MDNIILVTTEADLTDPTKLYFHIKVMSCCGDVLQENRYEKAQHNISYSATSFILKKNGEPANKVVIPLTNVVILL